MITTYPIQTLRLGVLLGALLMGVGCGHSPQSVSSPPELYPFNNLVLIQIKNSTQLYGTAEIARCPVCGTVYTTASVEPGAENWMTEKLKSLLEGRTSITLISEDQYLVLRDRILSSNAEPVPERDLLTLIAREFGADGIVTGSVYWFENRRGNNYSVESSASVGFELDLIETENGQLIWSRRYEEKQQALSENLFGIAAFFERKGRWLTVEDLAASGLEKVVASMPIAPDH